MLRTALMSKDGRANKSKCHMLLVLSFNYRPSNYLLLAYSTILSSISSDPLILVQFSPIRISFGNPLSDSHCLTDLSSFQGFDLMINPVYSRMISDENVTRTVSINLRYCYFYRPRLCQDYAKLITNQSSV